MKYLVEKDKLRRLKYSSYEAKYIVMKSLLNNRELNKISRYSISKKLYGNLSITRIKNRCIKTGRSHSVYKSSRLSRLKFREYAFKGLVPGLSKSSW